MRPVFAVQGIEVISILSNPPMLLKLTLLLSACDYTYLQKQFLMCQQDVFLLQGNYQKFQAVNWVSRSENLNLPLGASCEAKPSWPAKDAYLSTGPARTAIQFANALMHQEKALAGLQV